MGSGSLPDWEIVSVGGLRQRGQTGLLMSSNLGDFCDILLPLWPIVSVWIGKQYELHVWDRNYYGGHLSMTLGLVVFRGTHKHRKGSGIAILFKRFEF